MAEATSYGTSASALATSSRMSVPAASASAALSLVVVMPRPVSVALAEASAVRTLTVLAAPAYTQSAVRRVAASVIVMVAAARTRRWKFSRATNSRRPSATDPPPAHGASPPAPSSRFVPILIAAVT
jgi:hypothetical protein